MRASLLLLGLVGGCSVAPERDSCELAVEERSAVLKKLLVDEPACGSDSECVDIDLSVNCKWASVGRCSVVMHRTSAAQWNPTTVCGTVDRDTSPQPFACHAEPPCADAGTPVCRAGKCIGHE